MHRVLVLGSDRGLSVQVRCGLDTWGYQEALMMNAYFPFIPKCITACASCYRYQTTACLARGAGAWKKNTAMRLLHILVRQTLIPLIALSSLRKHGVRRIANQISSMSTNFRNDHRVATWSYRAARLNNLMLA